MSNIIVVMKNYNKKENIERLKAEIDRLFDKVKYKNELDIINLKREIARLKFENVRLKYLLNNNARDSIKINREH